MTVLHQVLLRLDQSTFTVNPLKCAWTVQSIDYLGFLLTINGIKPLPQKIEAISRISRPTVPTHVQSFVGLINYYTDMWPRFAHVLAPLSKLCGSKQYFKRTVLHENAFLRAKQLVTEDILLRFPDHSIPFEIFTGASNYQIGATIKQMNLPLAYFSKKLTPTQRRYSTMEQEMLVIVEVLNEYRDCLLGANITIFTDHKNFLSNPTVSSRVFR